MFDFVAEFCKRLNSLKPSELSRLRRATSEPSTDPRIFDILARLEMNSPEWAKSKLDICSVLYAICYQCPNNEIENFNFGSVLERNNFSEIRMKALLETDSENLNYRLRQALRFINSKRVFLDWNKIIKDILSWDSDEKRIQRKWAEGYYAREILNNKDEEK